MSGFSRLLRKERVTLDDLSVALLITEGEVESKTPEIHWVRGMCKILNVIHSRRLQDSVSFALLGRD